MPTRWPAGVPGGHRTRARIAGGEAMREGAAGRGYGPAATAR